MIEDPFGPRAGHGRAAGRRVDPRLPAARRRRPALLGVGRAHARGAAAPAAPAVRASTSTASATTSRGVASPRPLADDRQAGPPDGEGAGGLAARRDGRAPRRRREHGRRRRRPTRASSSPSGPPGRSSSRTPPRASGGADRQRLPAGLPARPLLRRRLAPRARDPGRRWSRTGIRPSRTCSPTRRAAARAVELTVVTSALSPRLVDRLAHRALGNHAASLVYVDAASFATDASSTGPMPPEIAAHLLRLQRAGVPVLVLRAATTWPRGSPQGSCGPLARRWLLVGLVARGRHGLVGAARVAVDRLAATGCPCSCSRSCRSGPSRSGARASSWRSCSAARRSSPPRSPRMSRSRTRARATRRATSSARSWTGSGGVPRLLRDAAPVRPPRLPRHAHGGAARDLRLHGADRHARHGAPAGGRGARPRRRGRLAGDPRPGSTTRCARGPSRSPACWRSSSCSGARSRPRGVAQALGSAFAARRRRDRVDHGRRGEAGVPLVADLGSVRPADRARVGQLRLGRQLRRDPVPGEPTTVCASRCPASSARSTGGRRRSTTTPG